MTYSVMWTLVPVGYAPAPANRLRFDVVATLRVSDNRPILGTSPLRDWPATLAAFGPLHVQVQGEPNPRPAALLGPTPDRDLWRQVFQQQTRVDKVAAIPPTLPLQPAPASFTEAADALEGLFASARAAGVDPTADLADDHPAMLAVRALAAPVATNGSRPDARETAARAVADPIAAYARSLRTPPLTRTSRARSGARAPKPLDPVPEIERADFHQVVGLLLNHPILAAAVGLRVRLEIAAFAGERLVRLCGTDGRLLQGEVPVRQPWSRVVAAPGPRRLVMATSRTGTPEVVGGMLDVASPAAARSYRVTTLDVPGLSAQLEAHARALEAEAAVTGRAPSPKNRLPVRRDAGLTVARRDRPRTVVAEQLKRSVALADPASAAEQVDGAPVLYADDVTTGFRLDVQVNDRPFASVMHRQVSYRVGTRELGGVEEGRIEGIVGVQQTDADDVTTLQTGEEVAAWDGWAVAVPRPGPKVAAQPGKPSPVEIIEPTTLPGYNVSIRLAPARGTLPRLRYGDEHTLRLRAVDLAGNSIEDAAIDPGQVLEAGRYLRREAASGPYLVPRRRYTAGESNERLVVRSEIGPALSSERHLAPPPASFALCEAHGLFDEAFGPSSAQVRARMLALARREQGSFLDPTVIGPTGQPGPARGIAVVSNDPTHQPAVSLPIPRGSTLPNGCYVIHDTDQPLTPYLCDPVVTGVTLSGLGSLPPVTATFSGSSWPERQPVRLRVVPTNRDEPKLAVRVVKTGGRSDLVIFVPPGFDGSFELSCSLDSGRFAQLDIGSAAPADVAAGLVLALSTRQPVSVVHPVRKPLTAPAAVGVPVFSFPAGTVAGTGSAAYEVHRATTGTLDVRARWTEHRDSGVGDVTVAERQIAVGSAVVDRAGTGPVPVKLVHDYGDTRHRMVEYRPIASTRFAEYFPRVPTGDPSQRIEGAGVMVSVPNRARPRPPVVHSIVPLFTHSEPAPNNGVFTKIRKTRGLRVYLARPWEQTGENERLGVVVPADLPVVNGQPPALSPLMTEYVSRWGADPIAKGSGDAAPIRLTSLQFANRVSGESLQLPLVDTAAAGGSARIVSHAVQFDERRGLWFADVALDIPDQNWPFVRLVLVRYQPKSLPGLELSETVRADFAQLPPSRTVTARKEGKYNVRVKVTGTKPPIGTDAAGLVYTVRQERRMPEPLDPSLDLGTDAGIAPGWQVVAEATTGQSDLANLLLRWTGPDNPPPPQAAELKAGRIVVEEAVLGTPLLPDAPDRRVTLVQTFDRTAIGFG